MIIPGGSPSPEALDEFDRVLADAILAGIERGGPAAVAEFLTALAETRGRPDASVYGYDLGDAQTEELRR